MDNKNCKCKPKGHEVTLIAEIYDTNIGITRWMELNTSIPIEPFVGMTISGFCGTSTTIKRVTLHLNKGVVCCWFDQIQSNAFDLLTRSMEDKGWRSFND